MVVAGATQQDEVLDFVLPGVADDDSGLRKREGGIPKLPAPHHGTVLSKAARKLKRQETRKLHQDREIWLRSRGLTSETVTKERLERVANREVRKVSTLQIWGRKGILWWVVKVSRSVFLFYVLFCGSILICKHQGFNIKQDYLNLGDGYRPYLLGILQFLAAFLTGFTMNEAMGRYKAAMSAALSLQIDVEKLRAHLTLSTEDPKFRVAVQIFLVWQIILWRKNLVFFTEDYTNPPPIGELIHEGMYDCVIFDPRVLWRFNSAHWEFILQRFISCAHLWDSAAMLSGAFNSTVASWKALDDVLRVRSPRTRIILTKVVVLMFLTLMPVFNDDDVTIVLIPVLAAVFFAVLELSNELSDPWDCDYHDIPLRTVMVYLATPQFLEEDEQELEAAVAWLNRGLTEDQWDYGTPGDCFAIPRKRLEGTKMGADVDFHDMRSLSKLAGFKSWELFLEDAEKDMWESEAAGARMPAYLRSARSGGGSSLTSRRVLRPCNDS
mmetsp:Transcript_55707/g.110659  ORF Transcript_55707/g.110659 Transcript_55707/m.110659 type:complete len:496 (+) Transcript_55707:91-1578(+)